MSLYKQLWIGIVILMLLAFAGSFMVSSVTVKRGVEEHLRIKNIDNANSLALAATQLSEDQTLVKLLMSAQFDNGHYQYIRWLSPEGDVLVDLKKSDIGGDAPEWFKQWVDIEAPAGTAKIQSGWQQLGSIELQSAPAFAYQALWHNTLRLLAYFGAAIPICGLVAHFLMMVVIRPLHQVVVQARDLRRRRFTKVALPATREFRELVVSMNSLSDEVRHFFESEASQLHAMQLENEFDPVSGTYSREYFLKNLNSVLVDANMPDEGSLTIFRIHDLQGLNRSQGRDVVDMMLKQMGDLLNHACSEHEHWMVGRLNGSDFAVLSPGSESAKSAGYELHKALIGKLEELELADVVRIPGSTCLYLSGESLSNILSRTDHALAVAETREVATLETAGRENLAAVIHPADYWRQLLQGLVQRDRVDMDFHALASKDGQLLHDCATVACEDQGVAIPYRQLHAWASRLALTTELDALTLRSVSPRIEQGCTVAVELSASSLQPGAALDALLKHLEGVNPGQLHLNIPEYLAVQDVSQFRRVCTELHARSFTIGLVNAGQHVENIGELYNAGISYIVLDGSVTLDINESESNQVLVRSLATIFHSIGSQVYAEGIKSQSEWEVLVKLGVDGGTGDYVDSLVKPGE